MKSTSGLKLYRTSETELEYRIMSRYYRNICGSIPRRNLMFGRKVAWVILRPLVLIFLI